MGNHVVEALSRWVAHPSGTGGWLEVMCGGVSTDELSSQTMESRRVPGPHFIGEVVWALAQDTQRAARCDLQSMKISTITSAVP